MFNETFVEGILKNQNIMRNFSQINQKIFILLPNSIETMIMNLALISDTVNQCRFLYRLVTIPVLIVALAQPPPQWNCVKKCGQWVSSGTMGQYSSVQGQWFQTTRRSFPYSKIFLIMSNNNNFINHGVFIHPQPASSLGVVWCSLFVFNWCDIHSPLHCFTFCKVSHLRVSIVIKYHPRFWKRVGALCFCLIDTILAASFLFKLSHFIPLIWQGGLPIVLFNWFKIFLP